MRRCSYCSKHYPDNDAVCVVDGTPLDGLAESSSPQVVAATAPQVPEESHAVRCHSAKGSLVTLVVIVVFLVAQKVRLPTLGEATPQPPDYRLKQHPQAGREKGDFLKHNR